MLVWLLAFPCAVEAAPAERTVARATAAYAAVEPRGAAETALPREPEKTRQSTSKIFDPGYRFGFWVLLILFLVLGTWTAAQWVRLNKLRARIGETAFLRIAFDETEEPMLVLRPSLRAVEANLAASATFGYDGDELRGMPLRALLGTAAFPRFVEASRRALRTGREEVDVTLLSHTSEWLPARATLRAFGEGEARRLLVAFRPASASTSEPDSLATSSEATSSEATSSEAASSEAGLPGELAEAEGRESIGFLSNLGHEMRTQLTGILGFAEVLEEELTGRQKETAQLVRRSGQRLLHTVNEILMLSRLEAGSVALHPQEVDVTAEIAEEVQLLLRWAEEKGLGLHVRQPAMPVTARVDPGAFRRVLENLVSNAIKYTERGTVEIGVDTDAEHLYLTVRDTGIGISPAFMPHLFEEFSRESSGMVSRQEGTGLGLAITKRLVEMMNGEIRVESEPGKGTRFQVVFPLHGTTPEEE